MSTIDKYIIEIVVKNPKALPDTERDAVKTDKAIKGTTKSVDNLNKAFGGLKTQIAALGIGAFITTTLNAAIQTDKVAQALGIAAQNVRGFQLAVQQAGGTTDQANDALADLVKNVGEAAKGSPELISAFRQVGVSLEDLGKLSEQELLGKVLSGLSKIGDSATQAALKAKIFGEALKTTNVGQVANSYGTLSTQSSQYAESAAKAREAQQKLVTILEEVKNQLVIALVPLSELIKTFNVTSKEIRKATEFVIAFTLALGTLSVAGRVFAAIRVAITLATTAITALWRGGALLLKTFSGSGTILGNFIAHFNKIVAVTAPMGSIFARTRVIVSSLGSEIKNVLALNMARLGILVPSVTSAFVFLFNSIKSLFSFIGSSANTILSAFTATFTILQDDTFTFGEKIKILVGNISLLIGTILNLVPFLNLGESFVKWGRGAIKAAEGSRELRNSLDEIYKQTNNYRTAAQEIAMLLDRAPSPERKRTLDLEKERAKVAALLNIETLQYGNNLKIALDEQIKSLKLEKELVKLTQDDAEIKKAGVEIEKAREDAVRALKDELQKLQVQLKFANDEEAQGLRNQIGAINQRIKKTEELYSKQRALVKDAMRDLQNARIIEEERVKAIERANTALQREYDIRRSIDDILRSTADKTQEMTFEASLQGMTPLQRQIAQIQEDARRGAMEEGRAFAEMFNFEDGMLPEDAELLAQGLDKITAKWQALSAAQQDSLALSRTWNAGWKEAYDNFIDESTNSANLAKNTFDSLANNMTNAIDQFVQTGKLSFKDFTQSVLKDLAVIFLRMRMLDVMKSFGNGAGFGNILKNLLGFANGGNPPVNRPSIVGERGPELFMPKTAGTIIPNNELGMGGVTNNTYITNNISAVDARSVAQLFAENRRSLLGATEQARKEMPMRQRF